MFQTKLDKNGASEMRDDMMVDDLCIIIVEIATILVTDIAKAL